MALKRSRSIPRGRELKRTRRYTGAAPVSDSFVASTRNAVTTSSVPRSVSIKALPKSMVVTLRYFEQVTIDTVGGGARANVFRANSCYDPNLTGTGHQPLGFDQWMGLYSKGACLSSKCTVKLLPSAFTTADYGIFGVCSRATATTLTTASEYIEDRTGGFACWIQAFQANQETSSTYSAFRDKSIKDVTDDASLAFGPLGDANNLFYYHVFVGAPDATTNPGPVFAQVLIEYKVKFYEPLPLLSS